MLTLDTLTKHVATPMPWDDLTPWAIEQATVDTNGKATVEDMLDGTVVPAAEILVVANKGKVKSGDTRYRVCIIVAEAADAKERYALYADMFVRTADLARGKSVPALKKGKYVLTARAWLDVDAQPHAGYTVVVRD